MPAPIVIPAGARYVALGSSFASGPGIPAQFTACSRSDHNYPHLVAAALHLHLVDVTCSGATTREILTLAQHGYPPQISAVTTSTALVTITIGGNNLQYSTHLRLCALAQATGGCLHTIDQTKQQAIDDALPNQLADVIAAVKQRAPLATIMVVTYPRIIPAGPPSCDRLSLVTADEAFLGNVGATLEQTLVQAAANAHVLLADPYVLGDGHGPCANDTARWVEGLVPRSPDIEFHPNANGHAEMAALVEHALTTA